MSPSGWGVRARGWSFDDSTDLFISNPDDDFDIDTPVGGDEIQIDADGNESLLITSELDLYLIDLEGIHVLSSGPWAVMLSAGARYADLSQRYEALEFGVDGLEETLFINHGFVGAGPTVAAEVHRAIGSSGFAALVRARAALLVGQGSYYAQDFDPDDSEFDVAEIGEFDDTMPVTEIELGVEYARTVGSLLLFGQVSAVAHTWYGAGNASLNELLVGDPDNGSDDSNPAVNDNNTNLTLFGLRVGGGFRY